LSVQAEQDITYFDKNLLSQRRRERKGKICYFLFDQKISFYALFRCMPRASAREQDVKSPAWAGLNRWQAETAWSDSI
jgi:hypothetical protein